MSVVDASVYVARLNPLEPGHVRSRAWFDSTPDLRAPCILLAEVAAAIARGTDDATLARQEVAALEADDLVVIEAVDLDLGRRASEIAALHRIRGCDAVYVALAERHGTDLVTLDRQQLERGSAVVTTREP